VRYRALVAAYQEASMILAYRPSSLLTLAGGLLLAFGCSSSAATPSADTDAGPAGGPVSGATDDHCAGTTVTVEPATCSGDTSTAGAGGASDSVPESAGGAADCTQTHDAEYGDTLFNSDGDDDDCKYHAAWSSTAIRLNQPVTFTITAMNKASGAALEPLSDGLVPLTRLDVYEPCNPNRRGPTQNLTAKITELMPGVFSAGPIKFDQPGRWVVRFHWYEQCVDGEHSPHGHIAFFVDVP
jgi:hypothetical protein